MVDTGPKLECEFLDDTWQPRIIIFRRGTLGLALKDSCPAEVERVVPGGHAQDLGVKVGWVLSKVDGKAVAQQDMKAVKELISNLVQRFPDPPPDSRALTIDFIFDGGMKTVAFSQAPLGMGFRPMNPFKVDGVDPNSYGYACGVREGWTVVGVAGQDMTTQEWENVIAIITEQSQALGDI